MSVTDQQATPGLVDSSIERSTEDVATPVSAVGSFSQGTTLSTEERLFEAMDKAALTFIEMLNDDRKDEDGNPLVDVAMKFKLFEKGQDWLIRRQKLRPKGDESEGEGIKDMRLWMSDPATREVLKATMFEEGFVVVPQKKNGRPKKAEEPVHQRYREFKDSQKAEENANDDSGWAGMLSKEDT